jgi:hypothetical protein
MVSVVMDGLLLACYMGNRVWVRVRTLARGHGLGDGMQKTGCRWGMADCRLMNFESKTPIGTLHSRLSFVDSSVRQWWRLGNKLFTVRTDG